MTDFLSGSTFTDRYVPYRCGWDGQELSLSSQGESVAVMQQYLDEIAQAYPAIPAVKEDGIFGVKTLNSLLLFQHFFQLDVDGIAGRLTRDRMLQLLDYIDRQEL